MQPEKPDGERVRKNTADRLNKEIDDQILRNIETYSKSPELIAGRIRALDKEWDIERFLEINMSVVGITGILLTAFVSIYCLVLPGILLLFFIQHAIQGWCPPVPFFRRLMVRTRPEIDREKYALKTIRGDFHGVQAGAAVNAEAVFRAVSKI